MRCPDCNKFVGLEAQDPEVESLEITDNLDGHATISGSVRCVLACADCGTELKEASFDLDHDISGVPESHAGLNRPSTTVEGIEDHELEVEEDSIEATESGGSRYKKNMRGFSLTVKVTCSACDFTAEETIEDSLQASAWDEMV